MLPPGIDNAPVFDLCDARERRFLLDLMQEDSLVLDDHPLPELHALLLALERMWGGTDAKQFTVPPGLMYYLVAYATYAHHIPEDVEGWRHSGGHNERSCHHYSFDKLAKGYRCNSHRDSGNTVGRITIYINFSVRCGINNSNIVAVRVSYIHPGTVRMFICRPMR
jgi:hypothetical protein